MITIIEQNFNSKDLIRLIIKANSTFKLGTKIFTTGEPILHFENVQIATITEQSHPIFAQGGKQNPPLVTWIDRQPVTLQLVEGILSNQTISILMAAELWKKSHTIIPRRELVILDNRGIAQLKYRPLPREIFVGEYRFGHKQQSIFDYTINENEINCGEEFANLEIVIDYYMEYTEEFSQYTINRNRLTGNFRLEGEYLTTDENEGLMRSNILIMPNIQIMSNLNFRFGKSNAPMVAQFNILALPKDYNGESDVIMQIYSLDEEL